MQITAATGKISKNDQGDLTINVALSAKNKNKKQFVSRLTAGNNKYDRKGEEVNVILKKKCDDKNLNLLNLSGLHLN